MRQAEAPAAGAMAPNAQARHVEAAPFDAYVPTAHKAHAVEPNVAYVPEEQAAQAESPVSEAYTPAAHWAQLEAA